MASSTVHLEIVTPDKSFFEGDIEMLIIRTTEGDIAILPEHEAVVAPLTIGSLRMKIDGKFREAAYSGGFMTVSEENTTTVITDSAEFSNNIDLDRAKSARERAAARLSKEEDKTIDYARARAAMARATNRLRVGGYKE